MSSAEMTCAGESYRESAVLCGSWRFEMET
jgi:hypothetical protein